MTVHEAQIGRYYEDFAVGDVFRHPFGRTIGETDNTWFTLLTLNTNQNHFNADFAGRSPSGKIIVNSGLTVALVLGLSVIDVSQNALLNLGWTDIRLTHPVFVGDTVYAESLITEMRESASRPYAGIVTARTRGLNQDGDEVVSWTRTVMVYKRDAPHDKGYFPEAKNGPLTA
ncbi:MULTISPECIES: MaoC family dehydratase [Actinomadura]|uniref:MaoC family dehydratase n=1 Tax=Actinomadura geliboluensis TaxID=882440 RepID=A0A5S4HB34_9ACTN|nr:MULTISPECIES: MaoC family dehydratase [Actinomadura]QKW36776.1 MaoC family dehydratase [Actinomadura sp. NAK00032]TMR42189.1 MaoC family dehydratase [Actinomadura geliboluensis]